jgi:hypothetical protein
MLAQISCGKDEMWEPPAIPANLVNQHDGAIRNGSAARAEELICCLV